MICPKCKKLVANVIFCVACGATVLTGHASEKPTSKFYLQQHDTQRVTYTTSSAQPATGSSPYTTTGTTGWTPPGGG